MGLCRYTVKEKLRQMKYKVESEVCMLRGHNYIECITQVLI